MTDFLDRLVDQARGEPPSVRPRPVPRFAPSAEGEQLVEITDERVTRVDSPKRTSTAQSSPPPIPTTRSRPPEPAAVALAVDQQTPERVPPSNVDRMVDRRATVVEQVASARPVPAEPVVTQTEVTVTRLVPEVVARKAITRPQLPSGGSAAAESIEPAEKSTVRITIGRIEVRAAPAPPKARVTTPARPPSNATSLDEYLKRRDRS